MSSRPSASFRRTPEAETTWRTGNGEIVEVYGCQMCRRSKSRMSSFMSGPFLGCWRELRFRSAWTSSTWTRGKT
ncbi:hypothetical protein DSECCO2_495540 [anaerobic digester metagenome]